MIAASQVGSVTHSEGRMAFKGSLHKKRENMNESRSVALEPAYAFDALLGIWLP